MVVCDLELCLEVRVRQTEKEESDRMGRERYMYLYTMRRVEGPNKRALAPARTDRERMEARLAEEDMRDPAYQSIHPAEIALIEAEANGEFETALS